MILSRLTRWADRQADAAHESGPSAARWHGRCLALNCAIIGILVLDLGAHVAIAWYHRWARRHDLGEGENR